MDQLTTIKEVKEFLKVGSISGVKCPCCDQTVKIYKRKLNSGMVRGLILAYHITIEGSTDKDSFFHSVREFQERKQNASTLEFSKLRHWGLIEQKQNKEYPDKKDSGFWRVTRKGVNFIFEIEEVQEYIKIYNGKFLGFEGEGIKIKEALGNNFNFKELMES